MVNRSKGTATRADRPRERSYGALGLSNNGRWLVSGGGMGEVFVHDLSDDFGACQSPGSQANEERRIHQIEMLPDGTHFVSVDSKGDSFLWDLAAPSLTFKRWIEGVGCRRVASGGSGGEGLVAALCSDGKVRLFGASGERGHPVPLPGGSPSTIAISADGRLLAVGYDDGRVVVRDKDGPKLDQKLAVGSIQDLTFSATRFLAVAHAQGLRLIELKDGPAFGPAIELFQGTGQVTPRFSADGRLLAACAKDTGELRVWRLGAGLPPQVVLSDAQAGVLTLAFSADSRAPLTGSTLGDARTWRLDERVARNDWTASASRGKIQHLATSPSRRFLLMVNELRQAHLWDLTQRSCLRLNGTWTAGVFVGNDTLVLAGRTQADQPARLFRFDLRTLKPEGPFFAAASGQFKIPENASFEALSLSVDGTRVAAAAQALVCVWETKTGRLTHWISGRVLLDPVFSLSLSSNARELATAGDSPVVRLWDLSQHEGALEAPAVTFEDPSRSQVTCVQIRPGTYRQLVTGHSDGRPAALVLEEWIDGAKGPGADSRRRRLLRIGS